jgi:SAM-dependent methyltransferase
MSTFSADWLALREPADAAARSRASTERLGRALASRSPLRVLDLGAGTGSNLRYLAPHLPAEQQWLLVDHDARLLDTAADHLAAWVTGRHAAIHVATRTLDLRAGVDEPALFAGRDLVTASALIDLVSEEWLRALAARCAESGAIVALALTYDGRISCTPAEPEDELVRELVNRHQRTDKGFGIATGPGAADSAEACFAAAGYDVHRAPSDWVLAPEDAELQRQLIDGWASAATEITPSHAAVIADWGTRRIAHVDRRRSRILVGHQDLVAYR